VNSGEMWVNSETTECVMTKYDAIMLRYLRTQLDLHIPKSNKARTSNVTDNYTWHNSYWDAIGSLIAYGGGLFVTGIALAIIIAGVGLIIAALLCWAIAILMVITYPIWLIFDWLLNR
jgi:ABC-type transport system involved in cytochrome bd biosynthesis fused ATPase/permease subunit